MLYIALGSLSFVFLFLFDVYTVRKDGIKKKIFGALGLGLLIYSATMTTVSSTRLVFSTPVRIIAAIGWLLSMLLLVYSLFLELPFVNTYGRREHSNRLVDTGTYALCRHPGVLWFGFAFFFFFLLTGARLIAFAGIIWTALDVLHVYIQEKLFFKRMFPDYELYIKHTPMLIPTLGSIRKCLSTI